MITIIGLFHPIQIKFDGGKSKNWRQIRRFLEHNEQTFMAYAKSLSDANLAKASTSRVEYPAITTPSLHQEDCASPVNLPISNIFLDNPSSVAEYTISWEKWSLTDDEHSCSIPEYNDLF
jgi:hypothetical protein